MIVVKIIATIVVVAVIAVVVSLYHAFDSGENPFQ